MVSKTMDGREMTFTADIYSTEDGWQAGQETVLRKEYTLLCYPGAFYIESARYVPLDDASQP